MGMQIEPNFLYEGARSNASSVNLAKIIAPAAKVNFASEPARKESVFNDSLQAGKEIAELMASGELNLSKSTIKFHQTQLGILFVDSKETLRKEIESSSLPDRMKAVLTDALRKSSIPTLQEKIKTILRESGTVRTNETDCANPTKKYQSEFKEMKTVKKVASNSPDSWSKELEKDGIFSGPSPLQNTSVDKNGDRKFTIDDIKSMKKPELNKAYDAVNADSVLHEDDRGEIILSILAEKLNRDVKAINLNKM